MQTFSASSKFIFYIIVCNVHVLAWVGLFRFCFFFNRTKRWCFSVANVKSNHPELHLWNTWTIVRVIQRYFKRIKWADLLLECFKNDWKMWVRVLVNFVEHDGRFVTFTNKTVNFCKLLSSSRYEPLIKLFYEVLLDISPTLVKRCPIQQVGLTVGFKMFQRNKNVSLISTEIVLPEHSQVWNW